MSRTGNCYDNAVMESFFRAALMREWTYHQRYATREAARQSLFEYIEVFCQSLAFAFDAWLRKPRRVRS